MLQRKVSPDEMCRIVDSPSGPPVLVFLCDSKDRRGLADRIRRAAKSRRTRVLALGDEDLGSFERRFAELLSDEPGTSTLDSGEPAPGDGLLTSLNRLSSSGRLVTILIIGYEHISCPAVHQTMVRILDFAPTELRTVFLAGDIPPVAIPRLLVRQRAEVYRIGP
ncbi:MAG TPA: hypothetical protein VMW69_11255 [Spirochaetia bacterium]|nr:hypothetical protein [Spirochaetia bacterium]